MPRPSLRPPSRPLLVVALALVAALVAPVPASGQTPAPSLVISEVMQNPSAVGDGAGEWFEIHNPGSVDVDLDGWTIGDNGIDEALIVGSVVVPAGGYAVLGNNADAATNGGVAVDYSYGTSWFLANGDDEIVLVDPSGAEVDRIEYDGGPVWPDPTGASMSLGDVTADNNVGGNWCESSSAYGAGDLGTPGAANDPCPVAPLVISEVMQNPAAVGDVAGEWFEIHNPGAAPVDLDGWRIHDLGADDHTIAGSVVVAPGGYVVLGNNADTGTNGGVSVDYQYSGIALANGDDEIVLVDQAGAEIDRIEYDGGPLWPDPNGASMTLGDVAADNNVGANWCGATSTYGTGGDRGTPGAANDGCAPVSSELYIHQIQGTGSMVAVTSPVTVQAVVTSLFEDNDALDGFFIQEEDVDADTDPATSEGIFVFCRFALGGCPTDLAVGDVVTVSGVPTDYYGMSQIDAGGEPIVIDSSGNALPSPAAVVLPASGRTDAEATFEHLEGMLVTFPDALAVSEYFQLARFGQLVLTADARPEQFTDANAPSVAGYAAFLDDLASRRIILDDDDNDNNDAISNGPDEPYPWPAGGLSITNRFRGGETITGLTGVLHWSFAGSSGTDAWRVRPVDGVGYTFSPANPRPTAPDAIGGSLRVASFNVLNYFTTLDVPGATCGPSLLDCRGANSTLELDRQRAKIVAAMVELDADVLGLIEIENDAGASADDLVAALNAATSPGTYAAIDTGTIGGDAIKVALVYKPAVVFPVGDHVVLDSSVDPTFIDDENRPVLIQAFEQVSDGARITIAVNHLKSKGSDCDALGDPDIGDGQGNCNLTRTAAANALVDFLATDPTGSGSDAALIIGDLNSYAMEDPIAAITGAGYTDLLDAFQGADAYSYVFDGQLGYLDHALASPGLIDQVTGTTVWHINADEPVEFDYNDDVLDPNEASFNRESSALPLYADDPYRSSDHDPVLVGLDLVPMCNGLPATIIGTQGDDEINGTRGPDVILARAGDDQVRGLNGDDVVCGGDGDDQLIGNNGDDVLLGGPGKDQLKGNNGADLLGGGSGDDELKGHNGDDILHGDAGFDKLDGGRGIDTCTTGEKVERCER